MSESDADKVDLRSEIPRFREATPPPAFGEFVENMRRLQDLAVSVDAPDEVYAAARDRAAELVGKCLAEARAALDEKQAEGADA